ncbi:MAG TPA: ABC transporter permease [Symbiobacteriaceae bacterium]|nr:ABC transporter permease [Symbiobacteriaceae bacterium]
MRRVIAAELQKWRRTWFLLVTVAATLATPLMVLLMFLINDRTPEWQDVFEQGMMFSLLLFGPLTVTLIGAQLIATEYQHDTWKLMFTAPVARWKVYLTKWLVGFVWIMSLSVLVIFGNLMVGLLVGATGPVKIWIWTNFFLLGGVGLSVMLPVYNLITLISRNFFVTSAIGIITTFAAVFVINSKYAGLLPQSSVLILLRPLIGDQIRPDMIGSAPLWLGMNAAIAATALVASTLFVQKADYR